MSRVGRAIIEIPSDVTVTVKGKDVTVKGPKGELTRTIADCIEMVQENNTVYFKRNSDLKEQRSLHGTTRAHIANMVKGVKEGFEKKLEIIGVGYRGEQKGKDINFLLGYSHHIYCKAPKGVTLKMDGNTKVSISGIDIEMVGQIAANIRAYRKPEPYKGKGVRYVGEYVRRKEVKKS